MIKLKIWLIYSILCLFSVQLWAQTKSKVEIIFARNYEGLKSANGNINKLIGEVQLKQGKTLMWCDSALIYEADNFVEAFSNVKINHNDSVIITGDYLRYDANNREAVITGKVVTLTDQSIVLTTTSLYYDMNSGIASYDDNATIISNENKLVSKLGYYYTRAKEFFFRKDVVLTNPDYVMVCDTLMYHTQTKVANFFGSTQITGKTDKIWCENGWYNTKSNTAQFSKNARLVSEGTDIKSDSMWYNRKLKLGRAYRNIVMYDSAQKTYLYGNFGETNGITKTSYVCKSPRALKLMGDNDSLLMWADTFMLLEPTAKQPQLLKAIRNVKLFKSDLQAVCDSLVYNSSDSMMQMFKSPVLWNGLNQITADTMRFFIKQSELDSFYFVSNSFVVSKEKGNHFNQIRGKNMAGRFDSSTIKYISVIGNGQSIYYAKEDSVNYVGVNVIDCSEMMFYLINGKISRAVFIKDADATLYPLDEKKPEELRLKGFKWQEARRPRRL